MPAEWRWVIVICTMLVLLAFAPFLWIVLSGADDWRFQGTLHNYQDGGSYLSKMDQGVDGAWLVNFRHTPEPHHGAFIQVIYPLLGQIARITSLSPLLLFHVIRVGAALFMYLALYHLGASIWQRIRTRRIFFVFAAVGSGLGWLFAPLFNQWTINMGEPGFPDLLTPEAFPLYSTYVNVHFPLTLACLALLASIIMTVFRPGAENSRNPDGSALLLGILSVVLALLYPQALVPFGLALGLYFVVTVLKRRKIPWWQMRWLVALALPTLPIAVYYVAIVTNIPAFALWNKQNVTAPPNLLGLALGLGLPLALAFPAILRSVRRPLKLNYDDRFMLAWLIAILVAMYLPTNVGRRFMVGLMIPVAYFVARAIEDFWFNYVKRRRRNYFFAIIVPLMMVSQLFVLFAPMLPIIAGDPQRSAGIVLESEYTPVFNWLDIRTNSEDVILAAPVVGTWLPGWAGTRVVWGHPYETLDQAVKLQQVLDWYAAEAGDPICQDLLAQYNVRFILVGPQERRLGEAQCAESLRWMARSERVDIYAP
jgi:hypothetical protein